MSIFKNLPIELKFKIMNMNTDSCIDCINNKKYLSNDLIKCFRCKKSICKNHQTDECKYKCKITNNDYYLCFYCSLDNSSIKCVNCDNNEKHLSIETYKCNICENNLCSKHSMRIINGEKHYGLGCCKYCIEFFAMI